PWNGPTTAATRAGTSHPNSTITYNMRQRRRDQAQTPTREKSRLSGAERFVYHSSILHLMDGCDSQHLYCYGLDHMQ
ncbi:hypothetical protein, partial [Brevibacterium moorei]|uniref:hypothetical protein n=1 Tax=Brevibacterium moorei TaxID=2968457 RepID=UPI00211B8D90